MKKISFSSSGNLSPQDSQESIVNVRLVKVDENEVSVCLRRGGALHGYSYSFDESIWKHIWNETIFPNHNDYPLDKYPWLVTNRLVNNGKKDVIILQHPDGVRLYEVNSIKPGLDLIKEDGHFSEVYRYNLLWGHFYPDKNEIGVIARNGKDVKFFVILNDSLSPNTTWPLFPLSRKLVLAPNWSSLDSELFLTKLRHSEPETIGLRTNDSLEFYEFNTNYTLDRVISTSLVTKSAARSSSRDRVFFADLTHQIYQDIIHLNDSGLFTYQYDVSQKDYKLLDRDRRFMPSSGWLSDYSDSIRLSDLNNDGRDDLLFTGVEGVTGLTFDASSNHWKSLLNADGLTAQQRFGVVVGILPALPPKLTEPSLFIQDAGGQIQWARTTDDKDLPTTPSTTTTLTTNTDLPRHSDQWTQRDGAVFNQIARKSLPEKPTLRWLEQWPVDFIKDAVDVAAGQVRFNIPLVDISPSTGWNVQIALSYDGGSRASDLLGLGWSLPLAQDYIAVDYQGSIYDPDARYFLVIQGRPQLLKPTGENGGLKKFVLSGQSDDDLTMEISYNQLEQHWTIDGPTEQVIYGRTNDLSGKDALQFSLAWPNWRGIGRDKDQQVPLICAWYLYRRFDKQSNRSLYYFYKNHEAFIPNGKGYTSAMHLRSITDGQDMNLEFEYSRKPDGEYTKSDTIDEEGNIIFPIQLEHSHYLSQFTFNTADYQQTLKFTFKIDDGNRLLTSIDQELSSGVEYLSRFTYENLLGQSVLSRCSLADGSSVGFSYQTIAPRRFLPKKQYPVRESPKIVYGSDYAVMAYRNLNQTNGKVFIRVMNRGLTKVVADCSVDDKLSCPSVGSEIKDYAIQPYGNSFVLLVITDEQKILYTYDRKKNTWSLDDSVHRFDKNALIRWSTEVIAVAEPDEKSLKILERLHDKFKWKLVWNEKRYAKINRLALQNKLVVAYGDNTLSAYYRDLDSVWRSKILGSYLGENLDMKKIDLEPKLRQDLSEGFNQNGLQLMNNFILFDSLELDESSSQLSSSVHLILLDSQYDAAKTSSFHIQRENLYKLNHKFESEDKRSVFKISYVKGRTFEARIVSASGQVAKHIDGITNKNSKEDAIKALLKSLNEKETLKKLKENFWINQDLYIAYLSPQGAHVGNDTLFRVTGTDWVRESLSPKAETTPLGKYFIMESASDDKLQFKLRKQGSKAGEEEKILKLDTHGQMVNRYPAYIAYHPRPKVVEVLTFRDEKTLGETHRLVNEQLLIQGSDFNNLITVVNTSSTSKAHSEPMECIVRPIFTLIPPREESFVSKMRLTSDNADRSTAYERSYHKDSSTFSETFKIIPGDEKNTFGWHEVTRSYEKDIVTTTQRYYNADGSLVTTTPGKKSDKESSREATSESNPSLLLDRSGRWLISDFSPYSLADEMVAYYGFEPYEKSQIGNVTANTKENSWQMSGAKIVKDNFALTGRHYLKLNGGSTDHPSFVEGVFYPRAQENTYLASCWIRCNREIPLGTPVSYLKAIIYTLKQEKVVGLQAIAKKRLGNWFYLELPLDFQVLNQIYLGYSDYHSKGTSNSTLSSSSSDLKIKLRVEAVDNEIVDLDHIRFSPLTHDFEASVFDPLTGKTTAIIRANGLVVRKMYNRLNREMADLDEDGNLQHFTSSSRTGRLVPTPKGSIPVTRPTVLAFEPDDGSHENFDPHSFGIRWRVNDPSAWDIAPSQLWHRKTGEDFIQAGDNLFDKSSSAMRLYFALQEPAASLSLNWHGIGQLKLTRQSNDHSAEMVLPNDRSIGPVPSTGELIAMVDANYLYVWLDGVLLVDEGLSYSDNPLSPWSNFELKARGEVLIEDCLIMNRPRIKLEYYNSFGEKTQVFHFEDNQSAQITETLYDSLGRGAITTKLTRIRREQGEPLLMYRSKFVDNGNPSDPQSVWQTGRLHGEVDQLNTLDHQMAYKQTNYAPNPLNQESASGLPGLEFGVTGKYSAKKSDHSDISFLDNLFPKRAGFRQKVDYLPNGSLKVHIQDEKNNQVAVYTSVPSFNHILSTYEYDQENRLIKVLSPLYHEKANTRFKLEPWQPGETHLSEEEKKWQAALATHFDYDKYGHLIRKTTPDTGTTEYLYNSLGQRRFSVSIGKNNRTENIVFFDYDASGQLIHTGYSVAPLPTDQLHKYLEGEFLPYSKSYQQFNYADDELDPSLRGRVRYYSTNNDGQFITEKVHFNADQQIATKETIIASDGPVDDSFNVIKKQYVARKVTRITYPIQINDQQVDLLHEYNRLGQLIGLRTSDESIFKATFSYHGHGQLATESYQLARSNNFTRHFHYNSPGFIGKISDPFLTEHIDYTAQGYGQDGFGDGMIMRTTFEASWPMSSDGRWFKAREDGVQDEHLAPCIRALQDAGYLDAAGRHIKSYIPDLETRLPLSCGGQTSLRVAKIVAQKQTPKRYGHSYAYGNHQELVKAKYFTGDTEDLVEPLQRDSFFKHIRGLTIEQSRNIWHLLTGAGYIIADQQHHDSGTAVGKPGKPLLSKTDLYEDLKNLDEHFTTYYPVIEKLITSAIGEQTTVSLSDFEEAFLGWAGVDVKSSRLVYNSKKKIATQIGQMLIDKHYLPIDRKHSTSVLNSDFFATLHQYTSFIPEIVKTLSNHFAHGLGKAAFDMESYDIDANGNHQLFYSGFNRYEIAYRNGTNQIQSLKLDWPIKNLTEPFEKFEMQHDHHGNVVQALHRNIQHIEYHPVSQRTTAIQLTDGRTIRFLYDASGERISKKVMTSEGEISHQTHYVRDEQGRVLVDQQIKYSEGSSQNITTAYLYGPRGLLGFLRNDSFYSISTDHAGSVRLVIKDGRVVAAYDYLPYGGIMRSFGSDPSTQVVYRYTGQEWDEETGLYNYHARLYDPSIGRFYQPDPKSQYFSPYMYAGNSPISLTDSDGELAFLIVLLAVGGAYLGGAAANNRWNPADWDWKDGGTWLGIGFGALAGGLAPVGFAASAGAIGVVPTVAVGLGGAYLGAAAANQNWNPTEWQWDRPGTFYGAFQGFVAGTGLVGSVAGVHQAARTIGGLGGKVFLVGSYSAGTGMAFYMGIMGNGGKFDLEGLKNPAAWYGALTGFDTGMGFMLGARQIFNGIDKFVKNSKSVATLANLKKFDIHRLKEILKNPKHPLYKVTGAVVMSYLMGSSANQRFDKWNQHEFSTYEGVINGVLFGKDVSRMRRLAAESPAKKIPNKHLVNIKAKAINWSRKLHHMLDNIQTHRLIQKYNHLAKKAFAKSDLWVKKLGDLSPFSRKQVEKFFQGGWKKFREGTNKIPTELHQLILREAIKKVRSESGGLTKWTKETTEKLERKRGIFPDEEQPFLVCKSAGRKRRGIIRGIYNKICYLIFAPETSFKDDPLAFIEKNAVNTLKINALETNHMDTDQHENNRPYKFALKPATGGGYHLMLDTHNSASSIDGYWLKTSSRGDANDRKAKLTLNLEENGLESKFVFTGQMQGCSLYTRRYRKEDSNGMYAEHVDIYHYNRPDLHSIYINEFQGRPIVENRGRYVTDRGEDIPELLNSETIFGLNDEPLQIRDNVIVLNGPIKIPVGERGKELVDTIAGVNVLDLVRKNQQYLDIENQLERTYGPPMNWETYLGVRANYVLLTRYYKFPRIEATMILHFAGGGANIAYKRIVYRDENPAYHMDHFEILPEEMRNPMISHPSNVIYLRRKRDINSRPYHTDISSYNTLFNATNMNQASHDDVQAECSGSKHLESLTINSFVKAGETFSSVSHHDHLLRKAKRKRLPSVQSSHFEVSVQQQSNIQSKQLNSELLTLNSDSLNQTGPLITIGTSDINGILSLTDLLARKWTGYRPKALKAESHDPFMDKNSIDVLHAIRSPKFMDSLKDEE